MSRGNRWHRTPLVCGWLACTPLPAEEPEPKNELPAPERLAREPATTAAPLEDDPMATSPELAQPGAFFALPAPEGDAVVWVPSGTGPHPLLLSTHGAGGSPEWHCAFWSEVVGATAFVLCPRGRPYDQSGMAFYFAHHHDLAERIQSALSAFDAGHGDRWTRRHSVYVGYSQGATMGALSLPKLGAVFEFALLIEGGYEQWPVKNARAFHDSGGRRAFLACGTGSCSRGAARSVRWLQQGGLEAKTATAEGAGHTPAGAVGEIAMHGLAWLTRDAESWQAFAHPEAPP